MIKAFFKAVPLFLLFPLAIIVWAVFALLVAGVVLGSANAWIMQEPFSDAWHAVWDRWFITLLWTLVPTFFWGSSRR